MELKLKKLLLIICLLLCNACTAELENQKSEEQPKINNSAQASQPTINAIKPDNEPETANINLEEVQKIAKKISKDKALKLKIWVVSPDIRFSRPMTYGFLATNNSYIKISKQEEILKILSLLLDDVKRGTVVPVYEPNEKLIETRTVFEFYSPKYQEYLIICYARGFRRGEDDFMQIYIKRSNNMIQSSVFEVKNPDKVMDLLNF